MQDEKLSGAVQENVLVLLCFSVKYAQLVRHSITPNLFESAVFRDIATHAIDFIDQFEGKPIQEHIADSLELILNGSDKRKATSYSRVLDNLFAAKDSINEEYIISQLNKFIRQQNLKNAVVKAVGSLEDGDIDQAEVDLQYGLNKQINSFEPGIMLGDTVESLKFFETSEQGIPLGIETLDNAGITLKPKEVILLIAPAKKGKSWFLVQVAKSSLLARKKVLIITLEMGETQYTQRIVQSFYAISAKDAKVKTTTFVKDSRNRLQDIETGEISRPTLRDDGMKMWLTKKMLKDFKNRPPLMVKQFATSTLTISALKSYLDGLERFHKFIPDVLVLDYPDLMQLDAANLRISTGQIYRDLRGIAIDRNIPIATVSQGNRESATSKLVTGEQAAEDYSKIATVDHVITYSQTVKEKELGLARLFVSQSRTAEDKWTSLITQSYATGQFCLDSVVMQSDSNDLIEALANPRESRRRNTEE